MGLSGYAAAKKLRFHSNTPFSRHRNDCLNVHAEERPPHQSGVTVGLAAMARLFKIAHFSQMMTPASLYGTKSKAEAL